MKNYDIHVLVKVNNEVRDVRFPSTKSVVKFEDNTLKIERENTFGEFVIAGVFNMSDVVGYYDDVRTSN